MRVSMFFHGLGHGPVEIPNLSRAAVDLPGQNAKYHQCDRCQGPTRTNGTHGTLPSNLPIFWILPGSSTLGGAPITSKAAIPRGGAILSSKFSTKEWDEPPD